AWLTRSINRGDSRAARGVLCRPARAPVAGQVVSTRNLMAMSARLLSSLCLPAAKAASWCPAALQDQHRVAEAKKPVSPLHGLLIRGQGPLPPQKRADQHEERGTGQVEVGHQSVHHLPPVARINEQIRSEERRVGKRCRTT